VSFNSDNYPPARRIAGLSFATQEHIVIEPTLYPNAPNPFDTQTQLSYRLPQDARVTLEITDSYGSVVAKLLKSEYQGSGSHTVLWNAHRLPSGTYYARLTVVNARGAITQKTQSMTLIR
jgi:hypothetical protein